MSVHKTASRPFIKTTGFKIMRTVVGAANPLVKSLLNSRFAGPLADNLLLLQYTGRKSGTSYTTPVGYARAGSRVVVVTSPTYSWWRSVVGGADVRVRLDGRWQDGRAMLLTPSDPGYDEAVALQVASRGPGLLKGFGIPVDAAGRVPDEARASAPTHAHIVQIDLGTSPTVDRRAGGTLNG